MYRCHLHIYLTGYQTGIFEVIKETAPLEHFTHEFLESGGPDGNLAAGADVILADLRGTDAEKTLNMLLDAKKKEAELILITDQEQFSFEQTEHENRMDEIRDLWRMPMSEGEVRFRFRKWQQEYKKSMDFWQESQYLEATIDNIPNLVWYKDKDGVHEKVNDSFCKTVNKTKQQVQGQRHAYIWDVEQDDPACIESERVVMEKQKTGIAEEVIMTGDGLRTLMTYKSPLYDCDGSVMGTVGVGIDVTREHAYAQEIVQKNRTLETIFMAMDCGVLCHSLDGSRIISINRAALKILGYESMNDMEADGFDMVADSVMEEDREALTTAIEELKEKGDNVSIEYRVRHKNGSVVHVMGNIKLLEENGQLYYQRFLLDCTEQKMQEKKNERYQKELIQALSIDYNFVWFFNLDTGVGSLLRNNVENGNVFNSFLGREIILEESMDLYVRNFVYEEDQEFVRTAFSREKMLAELSEKRVYYLNYRICNGGRIRYFQMKAVRAGSWNESRGVVLGFRNIDEETRNEMERTRQLEDALSSAKKASKAKSVFLSNMSHDIRTPMNAIVGFTNLAIAHMDQQSQVEEYLEKIKSSGNHLLSLINDVLDMSHIESGKMHIEEKLCSLPEILDGLYNILQADVKAKQLSLRIESVDILDEEIYCDKLRLDQVLLNLLSNAVKYTEKGGNIYVRVAETPGAMSGYANYEFLIKDTGIGMSEEFVTKIFEPFNRELDSTTSGIQGTGLGMAITKNIVEMMGGTISVKSEKGIGSEFKVSFTFRVNTGEKMIHMSEFENIMSLEEKLAEVPKGRILLAEDVELNQEIAATILGDAGFETEIAGNGQIAVEMLAKSEPGYYQVILMDVQMPVMNGYEATKEIRRMENKELASIPIIAMTANAFEEDKQEALRSGMNGHIAKPIDIDVLFGVLRQILK
ncbi:MAG: PAS domain S-box protein [Lachnospiraceae bacterium]|nr:PAS domain S-box protein [Lachnospiraceae bacterium]